MKEEDVVGVPSLKRDERVYDAAVNKNIWTFVTCSNRPPWIKIVEFGKIENGKVLSRKEDGNDEMVYQMQTIEHIRVLAI